MLCPLFECGFEYLNILIFIGGSGSAKWVSAGDFCVETIE